MAERDTGDHTAGWSAWAIWISAAMTVLTGVWALIRLTSWFGGADVSTAGLFGAQSLLWAVVTVARIRVRRKAALSADAEVG